MDSQQHALQVVQNTEFFPEWFIHGVESEFNPTVAVDLPSLFETSFEFSEGDNSAAFPDDLPEHPITAITSDQGAQPSNEVPQPNSKKRTRRTFGPVMGNNKTGRRGKLICLECRKIRSKCSYSSELDPCDFCRRRNLECVKVYGSKKRESVMTRSPNSEDLVSPAPVCFSLIRDSTLSESELSHLRTCFVRFSDEQALDPFSIILQNLWSVYGLTFTDRSLLYGALTWITAVEIRTRQNERGWSSPAQEVEHYTFKSLFHSNMLAAIQKNTVSESHLFALWCAFCGTTDLEDARVVHIRGFLDVLHLLNENYERGTGVHSQPLRYLYHFVLCSIRRSVSADYPRTLQMENELYSATTRLVPLSSIPDERVMHGSRFSPVSKMHSPSGNWILRNDIQALMATYSTFSNSQCSAAELQLTTALTSIRTTLLAAQVLPDVRVLFESIHSLRRYQISLPFLAAFIIDYFQLISLYSAVEFLQFGTMEFQTASSVTIVRQARWMVENMDHDSQGYLRVPLFGALALLLTNICGDKEELMDQKNWVLNGLSVETLRATEGFEKVTSKRMECGMIGRIEEFWRGTGTKDRLRQFMAENTWIWYTHMGHESFKIMLEAEMFE